MRHMLAMATALSLLTSAPAARPGAAQGDDFDRVTPGYATSDGGVKIHHASPGSSRLVVVIHGFLAFF